MGGTKLRRSLYADFTRLAEQHRAAGIEGWFGPPRKPKLRIFKPTLVALWPGITADHEPEERTFEEHEQVVEGFTRRKESNLPLFGESDDESREAPNQEGLRALRQLIRIADRAKVRRGLAGERLRRRVA